MPRHRRAAIRAEKEPRQRQRPLGAGRQAHVAPRQLAHQAEGGRVHYRLVRAGRTVPLGLVDGEHRLAPEIGLAGLALHERARIGLVRQDAQHRARVPGGPLPLAEVRAARRALCREILVGAWHKALIEHGGYAGGAHAADARVEDAAHNAGGFRVDHKPAAVGARPLGVAVGGEGANELAAAALGGKRRLGLGGGVAAVHVVEEVLHRQHQRVGRRLLGCGVVAVGDGHHAHAERREHLVQVARHVQVVAAEAAQVLDHDAVDLAGLHVGEKAAPSGAVLEGGAREAVVGVLGDDAQASVRVGEVADHGVLVEHRAAGTVALVVDGEPGVAGGAIDPGRCFWRFGFGHEKASFCTCLYVRQEALRMPSGCAALPAKKKQPTPRALVCVWRNRTTPSATRRRRRRKSQG